MRQSALATGESSTNLSQRISVRQMAEQHRYKLIPTSKPTRMPFCFGLLHRSLKIHSRKNLKQLTQDAAKSLHGADSSFLIAVFADTADRIQRISPFSGPLVKNLIWTVQPREEGWLRQ